MSNAWGSGLRIDIESLFVYQGRADCEKPSPWKEDVGGEIKTLCPYVPETDAKAQC